MLIIKLPKPSSGKAGEGKNNSSTIQVFNKDSSSIEKEFKFTVGDENSKQKALAKARVFVGNNGFKFQHANSSKYQHDCEMCKFLGTIITEKPINEIVEHDLYVCYSKDNKPRNITSVLFRYGDQGQEYLSYRLSMMKMHWDKCEHDGLQSSIDHIEGMKDMFN